LKSSLEINSFGKDRLPLQELKKYLKYFCYSTDQGQFNLENKSNTPPYLIVGK